MSLYQQRQSNGQPLGSPSELPTTFANISCFNTMTDEELATRGWYPYDGPAPVVVPDVVQMWQLHAACASEALIDGIVAGLTMPQTYLWSMGNSVNRSDGIVSAIQTICSLTSDQVDALFILAASYTQ
jgi:hypothetical protein